MKLCVVVTVLLTCGTYDELIKSIKNLPIIANDHVERWFIWIKNDDDGAKINDTSTLNENASSLKCLEDIAPSIPRDNSHYVEGQSRYIWIPDGRGQPHLVDLWEAVDEDSLKEWKNFETEYWLYTRKNPKTAQELDQFKPSSITYSNFDKSQPITVIVHGWLSNGRDTFSTRMKSTFLSVQDGNIIIVDWRDLAQSGYGTAVQAVPEVGRHIARFLAWLIETGGASWDNVHLVGFSLGAHIAGSAGRFAGGRPGRVTGLDPAGPLFHGNPDNLNPHDGQYVEAIHTDGDRLGHFNRLGQADFYVNGGRNPQPECFLSTCSHSRVVDLFAASVRYNHLVGRRCERGVVDCKGSEMKMGNAVLSKRGINPNYYYYVNGGRNPQPEWFLSTCFHSRVVDLFAASVRYNHLVGRRCENGVVDCKGSEMKMGNAVLSKRGNGVYSVKTSGIWPYAL